MTGNQTLSNVLSVEKILDGFRGGRAFYAHTVYDRRGQPTTRERRARINSILSSASEGIFGIIEYNGESYLGLMRPKPGDPYSCFIGDREISAAGIERISCIGGTI